MARTSFAMLAAGLWVTAHGSASGQTFRGLGFLPGGDSSLATAVSGDGLTTVGYAAVPGGLVHAFKWTTASGMQDLLTHDGVGNSRALALSADGAIIAGQSYSVYPPSGDFAMRWSSSQGWQLVDNHWRAAGSATGGDGAIIVGDFYHGTLGCTGGVSDDWYQSFAWTPAATFFLDNLAHHSGAGGISTNARAVSMDGRIIAGGCRGLTQPCGAQVGRVVIWTNNSIIQDLGDPAGGGTHSCATAANQDGSVLAAFSQFPTGATHAFRWTGPSPGVWQDLLTLPGKRDSFPAAISAIGDVVVGKGSNPAGDSSAFLWKLNGSMVDLNVYLPAFGIDLTGWTLTEATGVSANGLTIVGNGVHNGVSEGWMAQLGIVKQLDTRERNVTDGDSNDALHHTDLYRLPHAPITTPPSPPNPDDRTLFRRGQYADIDIEVYQPFDPAQTRLNLGADHTFDGPTPTRIAIPLYDAAVPAGAWGCTLLNLRNGPTPATRIARVRIQIPPTAPVGQYTFSVIPHCVSGNADGTPTPFPKPVVVLFNPWSSGDAVYMSGDAERTEYVLRESGAMWSGYARSRRAFRWEYNQFTKDALLVSLDLLGGLSGLSAEDRRNPTRVSARLASQIRNGDMGVLFGRWDGNYAGGVDPVVWNGSDQIFAQYRTTGTTVRYGQCWVFGGLLTSSLRTLGIPARPVSNFESGHAESTTNLVIGSCWTYDATQSPPWIVPNNEVWRYHVWCEGWMQNASPQPQWQVLDATYEIGPVPVSSVRARDMSSSVARFVLGEVDANVETRLRVLPSTTCGPVQLLTDWVGRRITTLEAGSYGPGFGANDITATYKTPEMTPDPRAAEEIEITAPADSPLGSSIAGTITARNFDAQARNYTCYMHVRALAENGNELGLVLNPRTDPITIAANGSVVLPADVPWAALQQWMTATDVVEYVVVLTRVNDEQRWFKRGLVRVRGLPVHVVLAPADRVQPGGMVLATVTYSNPLPTPLTNATLQLGGDAGLLLGGAAQSETLALGTVAPGASASIQRQLVGAITGQRSFLVRLLGDGAVPGDDSASILVAYCTADFDDGSGTGHPDGGVTIDDLLFYLGLYAAGDVRADVDDGSGTNHPDGGVTIDDLLYFLAHYAAGC